MPTLKFALVMPIERDPRAACMLTECRLLNAVYAAFLIIIVGNTKLTH